MSALVLKTIAIVAMLLDHIGYVTGSIVLRAIGRLSLPIFAFLIANGFKHTRSVPKYALRLLIFAILSEIPFDLFAGKGISIIDFGGSVPNLLLDNVFFTLLLGLVYLWINGVYKKKQIKYYKLASVATLLFIMLVAGYISCDYGVVGVAWVALFGTFDFREKKNLLPLFAGATVLACWRIIARAILVAVYRLTMVHIGRLPVLAYFFAGKISIVAFLQPIAIVSLFAILLYNGKSGMPENKYARVALKYAFYAFYPLHMLLLYFIAL